jgi:predicted regulator of Ras-like GTPase activity (Roadblock/LC7/MglB family)
MQNMQSKRDAMTRPRFRSELIDETLRRLHQAVNGIKASVVVNRDGLLVASFPAGNNDEEEAYLNPTSSPQVAAMAATLIGLAERTLDRLDQGELNRLMMEGESGVMIVYPAGRATLAVLVDKDAQLSKVLYGAKRTAEDVATVLNG